MTSRSPAPSCAARRTPDLDAHRRAAEVVVHALSVARAACTAGATTADVDARIADALVAAEAAPLFLGYRQGESPPFPAVSCISINDEVVHGVPGRRVIAAGDLVCIDVGVRVGGWCGDAVTTIVVEPPAGAAASVIASAERRRELAAKTSAILAGAIDRGRPGRPWSEVADWMERAALEAGCGVVTEFVGHGIGRRLHETPKVPSYRSGFTGADFELEPGMVLAIEPMLTGPDAAAPRTPVRLLEDRWTVVTRDGSDACHQEAMVLVTPRGLEPLTPV